MGKDTSNIIISILIIITPLFWNYAMWVINSYFLDSRVLYIFSVVSSIIGLLLLSKTINQKDKS